MSCHSKDTKLDLKEGYFAEEDYDDDFPDMVESELSYLKAAIHGVQNSLNLLVTTLIPKQTSSMSSSSITTVSSSPQQSGTTTSIATSTGQMAASTQTSLVEDINHTGMTNGATSTTTTQSLRPQSQQSLKMLRSQTKQDYGVSSRQHLPPPLSEHKWDPQITSQSSQTSSTQISQSTQPQQSESSTTKQVVKPSDTQTKS